MTMTLISTVTVGAGGTSGVTFSSIPQTYTDLVLVSSARALIAGANGLVLWFNGYGSSSFSDRTLYGDGSSVASETNSAGTGQAGIGWLTPTTSTASTFQNGVTYIPNYTGATSKSFSTDSVSENNATAVRDYIFASRGSDTAAVSQISIGVNGTGGANGLAQYSSFSLYGITKGSGGASVA